ncbi:hypothetical protein OCF84_21065 (plasmid) [Shewanella xiamenensis]|uniref:Uncharacterized protein n=1 Tax=Shewanella xiamenensis TaxID=332186 RepID=A0ABT6UFB3_9GAMM|nr:hypothetical protein [Shewanella xiamenensis]MDI5832632.1 hypothetical protein [Shewanella xiamenensis]WHF58011.1 hypothetical protein OCF84_21065 [Shewanella xiamenensis]
MNHSDNFMKNERFKAAIRSGFNSALLVDFIKHNPSINPVPSASAEFIAYALSDRVYYMNGGSECRIVKSEDDRKQILVKYEGQFIDPEIGIVPEPLNHSEWNNPILEKQFSEAIYDIAEDIPSMLNIKQLGYFSDADMLRGTACLQLAMKLYRQFEIATPEVFDVDKSLALDMSALVKGQILNCLLTAGLPVDPKVVRELGLYEYQHIKKALMGPRPHIGIEYLKSMIFNRDGSLHYQAAKSVLSEFTNFHRWPNLKLQIKDLALLLIEHSIELDTVYRGFIEMGSSRAPETLDVEEKNIRNNFHNCPLYMQYSELKVSFDLVNSLTEMIDTQEPKAQADLYIDDTNESTFTL